MALFYHDRNLQNINQLAGNTKIAALKWHDYLVQNDINMGMQFNEKTNPLPNM